MKLKIHEADAFTGTTSQADLVSYAGGNGTASLSVLVAHGIHGPDTSYVVFRNGKVWHNRCKTIEEAVAAWNTLVERELEK